MALLIDMIILLLLAGTLGYAYLMDRRVRTLMLALRNLEPVVDQFSAAVDRTETTVNTLREESAAHVVAKRNDEPPLTRTVSNAATSGTESSIVFRSVRAVKPVNAQLPHGIARVTGKADLVRGFFETIRSREA